MFIHYIHLKQLIRKMYFFVFLRERSTYVLVLIEVHVKNLLLCFDKSSKFHEMSPFSCISYC